MLGPKAFITVLAASASLAVAAASQKVLKLPAMGFNTWNAYGCDIDETRVRAAADQLVSTGLAALGYTYVNVDDCYQERKRSAAGEIVANTTRFPAGMKALGDYVHSKGLKYGIYSDAGYMTCGAFPGSFGYEEKDVQTFRSWGVDYLKYDNCYIPEDSVVRGNVYDRYQRMRNAIDKYASGKMVFSLCPWGWDSVWQWGAELGESWRTTGDVQPNWPALMSIVNKNSFITGYTQHWGHNDLDMLEIGNGAFTFEEMKSHFTAWALMKSPLIIGADISKLSAEALSALTNPEIIAINQDSVYGESVAPFRWGRNPQWTYDALYPAQYWSGRSKNGTVVMLLNTATSASSLAFNFTESPWLQDGQQYQIRDLWAHKELGTFRRKYSVTVPAHGVVALLFHSPTPEPAGTTPLCAELEDCTLANGTQPYGWTVCALEPCTGGHGWR